MYWEVIGNQYIGSLERQSDLAPGPHYGSNLGNKIADFVFSASISFITALQLLNVVGGNGKPFTGSLEAGFENCIENKIKLIW